MGLVFRREFPTGFVAESAYGHIAQVTLDPINAQGQLILNVHPTVNDWQRVPAEQVPMVLGNPLPTMDAFMEDKEFADAFAVIAGKIYRAIVIHHPDFHEAKEA